MHKRLFIAIKINPTAELLDKIAFLENNLSRDLINWTRKDHYHLTLKFLGKVSEKRILGIIKTLRKVLEQESCFTIGINSIGIFGSTYNPRVLWLGISDKQRIVDIHKQMELDLKKIGFFIDNQNFVPHISIARIKKLNDRKFFQTLLKKSNLENIQAQEVNEIILYESILNTKGAEYQVIETFPLGVVKKA